MKIKKAVEHIKNLDKEQKEKIKRIVLNLRVEK